MAVSEVPGGEPVTNASCTHRRNCNAEPLYGYFSADIVAGCIGCVGSYVPVCHALINEMIYNLGLEKALLSRTYE